MYNNNLEFLLQHPSVKAFLSWGEKKISSWMLLKALSRIKQQSMLQVVECLNWQNQNSFFDKPMCTFVGHYQKIFWVKPMCTYCVISADSAGPDEIKANAPWRAIKSRHELDGFSVSWDIMPTLGSSPKWCTNESDMS